MRVRVLVRFLACHLGALALASGPAAAQDREARARELLLELTAQPRLAGTSGSLRAARFVARELEAAGWRVEIDEREVLLSLPRATGFAVFEDGAAERPLHERRERFDPDAIPAGDVPCYSAWSASASVRGPVVDAGRGMRADFERLRRLGVRLEGSIALVRYGGSYRGVKVELATEFGCAGVLLFDDPAQDGPGQGPTWPEGPWKPDTTAQRGSISPMNRAPGDPSTPGVGSPRPGVAGERLPRGQVDAALPRIPCLPIPAREALLLLDKLRAAPEEVPAPPAPPAPPAAAPAQAADGDEHGAPPALGANDSPPAGGAPSARAGEGASGAARGESAAPGSGATPQAGGAPDLPPPPRTGPGPVEVLLDVDAPRTLRTIRNVIATLPGRDQELVIAGNHRDAWVRGAHDAGSGTVALLLAAEELGRRARAGWQGLHTVVLAFWDAEEFGLIGSTEWGEAHAGRLRRDALVYLNADAAVSGTQFQASGAPGLLGTLLGVLDASPGARGEQTLGAAWRASFRGAPRLSLPGSGSDFAVFLHHLSIPSLDIGFSGNRGGQYHTEFDDFAMVERFLDPGFVGHALAGRFVADFLARCADDPRGGFDDAEAARAMVELAREAGAEPGREPGAAPWLGTERAERLAAAFEELARLAGAEPPAAGARFYPTLADEQGLAGRPWYRNPLWAPGLETGYSSESWPALREAARTGPELLDAELERLLRRVAGLAATWSGADR